MLAKVNKTLSNTKPVAKSRHPMSTNTTTRKKAMDNPRQGIKKVSTSVGVVDTYKKHDLEAAKRLEKVEKDYLHASQKYEELKLQRWKMHCERHRAINLCCSAERFKNYCNRLVESLQKTIDKLPTAETNEIINHVNAIPNKRYSYALVDEPVHSLEGLESSIFNDFGRINREIRYDQRRMLRACSRKAVNDLLKEVRKKKTCRDKAVSNFAPVCNPTSHDSLRKSVEHEIVVLKKLIREIQKDFEEKLHIEQYAIDVYESIDRKVKHLEVKKERLLKERDTLRLNISKRSTVMTDLPPKRGKKPS